MALDGTEFDGIRYLDGPRHASAPFDPAPGRGVRRTVLHAALSKAVTEAGVKVIHGEVGEVTQDAASVCAAGIRARYLAAADGLHSPISHRSGCRR